MNYNLIVGCGFSGATLANLIASKLNEKVIIVDKKIILQVIVTITVTKTEL